MVVHFVSLLNPVSSYMLLTKHENTTEDTDGTFQSRWSSNEGTPFNLMCSRNGSKRVTRCVIPENLRRIDAAAVKLGGNIFGQ